MHVFDLTTGRQRGRSFAAFSGPSFPVEFRPGNRLVVADGDRLISWRFSLQTSPLVSLLPMRYSGRDPDGLVFPWSTPDGSQIITVNPEDRVARRWRASDGADLGRFLDDRAAPQ